MFLLLYCTCSHCFACEVKFTFTNRKHHCRNCSETFCGKDSARKITISKWGEEPVRVCDECFENIALDPESLDPFFTPAPEGPNPFHEAILEQDSQLFVKLIKVASIRHVNEALATILVLLSENALKESVNWIKDGQYRGTRHLATRMREYPLLAQNVGCLTNANLCPLLLEDGPFVEACNRDLLSLLLELGEEKTLKQIVKGFESKIDPAKKKIFHPFQVPPKSRAGLPLISLLTEKIFTSKTKPVLFAAKVEEEDKPTESTTIVCPECQGKLDGVKAKFCKHCGKELPAKPKIEEGASEVVGKIIFKCNDDLRQDLMILQAFAFMNTIWKKKKLNFRGEPVHAFTYGALALDDSKGPLSLSLFIYYLIYLQFLFCLFVCVFLRNMLNICRSGNY